MKVGKLFSDSSNEHHEASPVGESALALSF